LSIFKVMVSVGNLSLQMVNKTYHAWHIAHWTKVYSECWLENIVEEKNNVDGNNNLSIKFIKISLGFHESSYVR
jgi:hypothetical protein